MANLNVEVAVMSAAETPLTEEKFRWYWRPNSYSLSGVIERLQRLSLRRMVVSGYTLLPFKSLWSALPAAGALSARWGIICPPGLLKSRQRTLTTLSWRRMQSMA